MYEFQKVLKWHILNALIGNTIGAAMQALKIATPGTFPKKVSKFMDFRFIFAETIMEKLRQAIVHQALHQD